MRTSKRCIKAARPKTTFCKNHGGVTMEPMENEEVLTEEMDQELSNGKGVEDDE